MGGELIKAVEMIKGTPKGVLHLSMDQTKGVEELKKELKAYEKRFKMRSEEFFSRFSAGELEDSADFFEWSALYQMYLRVSERLNILKSE